MAMVKRPEASTVDLKIEATKAVFCGMLEGLKHPYILPVLEVDYIPEKEFLVTFRPLTKSGSIRDLIHNAKPRDPYARKYDKTGKQLSLRLIREYGRQILEALLFLRSRRIPFPQLHSGNVILDREKKTCRLTEVESSLINIEPRYSRLLAETPAASEVDVEALCFGHVLYEMACGFELSSPVLDCVPPHCYREVGEVLEGIFNPNGDDALTSIKSLLRHPLFAEVSLREDLTDVSGPLSSGEKDLLKLAKKGGGGGKKKEKKKKQHSSKTISSTSVPEDATWTGGVAGGINAVGPPKQKTYHSNSTSSPARQPPPQNQDTTHTAVAEPVGGRGPGLPSPDTSPPTSDAPSGEQSAVGKAMGGKAMGGKSMGGKAMGGSKGDGKGSNGGKGAGKGKSTATPRPAPKKPASGALSSAAAASATMSGISDLGSPEAVLAMLKKAKKPKKKALSFKEKLAAQLGGR